MRLTKNTWTVPVACKSLFSCYIQNKSEVPQGRHDAALKIFMWRHWLMSSSDVRVHWLAASRVISFSLRTDLTAQTSFLSVTSHGLFLNVCGQKEEDSFALEYQSQNTFL